MYLTVDGKGVATLSPTPGPEGQTILLQPGWSVTRAWASHTSALQYLAQQDAVIAYSSGDGLCTTVPDPDTFMWIPIGFLIVNHNALERGIPPYDKNTYREMISLYRNTIITVQQDGTVRLGA